MSESRIKQMNRIARISESVYSFNPRQSAIRIEVGFTHLVRK